MSTQPRRMLLSSLKHVKETLAAKKQPLTRVKESASGEAQPPSMQPRKRLKPKEADGNVDVDGNFIIRLPHALNKKMYSPGEAVAHIHSANRDKESLSGTSNKTKQCTFLKQYKKNDITKARAGSDLSAD